MDRLHKLMILFCCAVLSAGCSKETVRTADEDGVMKFRMSYPGATKVAGNDFEQNDKIGLFVVEQKDGNQIPLQISGNWANNVPTSLTAEGWIPAKKIFWSENIVDVYGYYPYMSLSSVDEQPFAIALDQTTETTAEGLGGLEVSDFLWAKTAGAEQSQETVALQFKHCLSKFVVKLVKGPDYEGDFPENANMYLHNTVTTAHLDLVNGVAVKNMFGDTETIKMQRVDDGTYQAVVVPQRVDSRRPFIELIANGVSYLLESTFVFRAGKVHTMSLVINSNPDQISIDIGGSVEGGWN